MRNAIMQDIAEEYTPSDMAGTTADVEEDAAVEATVTPAVPEEERVADDAQTVADAVADKVPLEATMRARAAVLEAILDEYVEDTIENPAPGEEPPTREEALEMVNEIVDDAVESDVVAPAFRRRIPAIINRHYRRKNNITRLYAKAAKFAAATLTEVKNDAVTVDPVIDVSDTYSKEGSEIVDLEEGTLSYSGPAEKASGPASMFVPGWGMIDTPSDEGVTIDPVIDAEGTDDHDIDHVDDTTLEFEGSNPTSTGEQPELAMRGRRRANRNRRWAFSEDEVSPAEQAEEKADVEEEYAATDGDVPEAVKKEVVDPEKDVESEDVANETVAATMRLLSASTINERKATVMLSRAYTSSLVRRMGHELRYILPRHFVQKYGIR